MIDDLVSLRSKFEMIKNAGWIMSMRDGTTGIGYTFECLLGKEEESFPIPDYGTIEIKPSRSNINRGKAKMNEKSRGYSIKELNIKNNKEKI